MGKIREPVPGDHFKSKARLLKTDPLYSAAVGGDPLDAETRLGEPSSLHKQAMEALGDQPAVDLGSGIRAMREATGGVVLQWTFPPGAPNVHEAMSSGFVDTPSAPWWLPSGDLAPGAGGTPLSFAPQQSDSNDDD